MHEYINERTNERINDNFVPEKRRTTYVERLYLGTRVLRLNAL